MTDCYVFTGIYIYIYTLPKTNIAPKNGGISNRNLLFQWSIFMGYVSFRDLDPKTMKKLRFFK